jgi:small subunit ribosomal protein S15
MLSATAARTLRTTPLLARTAVASTSSSPSLLLTQSRQFSASAPTQETKAKKKTRLVRKANLEKKASLVRQHEAARPDPVLGFAKGNDDLWEKSQLKSILLSKEEVWGTTSATPGAVTGEGEGYTPKLFNFGLSAEDAAQLSEALPATAALRSTLGDQATSVDAVMLSRFEEATEAEQRKRDTLMRIVDLRNADSKGIEVENTRRIIAAFGRTPGDTASPEVQCAFLSFFLSLSSLLC